MITLNEMRDYYLLHIRCILSLFPTNSYVIGLVPSYHMVMPSFGRYGRKLREYFFPFFIISGKKPSFSGENLSFSGKKKLLFRHLAIHKA